MSGYAKAGAALAAIALLLGACSAGDDDGADEGVAIEQAPETADDGDGQGTEVAEADSAALVPAVGQSVIKDAALEIEVKRGRFETALQEATRIAGLHGGFVLSTTIEDAERGVGMLTVRIPSKDFEKALSELQGLGKVGAQTVSGEDVGEEFIDLEARLRNLRAQESVFLGLMDRAATIEESIRVQRELTPLQLDIERLQGRLRFLRDRTELGTIALTLREAGVAVAETTTLAKAWERAAGLALAVVSALIVGAGVAVPLAVIALVVLLLGRLVLRRPLPRSG
jgi:hypothetical protein